MLSTNSEAKLIIQTVRETYEPAFTRKVGEDFIEYPNSIPLDDDFSIDRDDSYWASNYRVVEGLLVELKSNNIVDVAYTDDGEEYPAEEVISLWEL